MHLKGLRATLHTDNGIARPTDATQQAVRAAADVLMRAGVLFDDRRPPGIEQSLALYLDLFNWDGGAWQRLLRARAGPARDAATRASAVPSASPAVQVIDLIDRWDRFRARMHGFLQPYDLLLCPVSATPALPHGDARSRLDTFSYTMTYSLTGWPAACVRAGTSPEGLPIGVQIVARPWREHVALAAAAEVEHALGGWRPPAI